MNAPVNAQEPRRPTALLASLGIVILVAIGVTVAAISLRGELATERGRSARLDNENRSLSDALELYRGEKAAVDTKLTVCEREVTTAHTTLSEKEAVIVEKEDATRVCGSELKTCSTQWSLLDLQLTTCRTSVVDLVKEQAEKEKLVSELSDLTSKFQGMIDSGKLDVSFRRGKMVVKLPAAILFPSGSADLSEEGKTAIAGVAGILKEMKGRRFTVAGHTDSLAIVSGDAPTNLELSAMRAITVTEILKSNGVPARNLAAAGFGEYDPVASNKSAAGRQKNRRIEIILEPELRDLPAEEVLDKVNEP